jgi:carbamoyltransferase
VIAERVADYFEQDRPSPYMLIVAGVKENLRRELTPEQQALFGIDKLNI